MKLNCWQYMKCGREPGGVVAEERGVCCAATETRCDGVNSGRNAGRACWLVAGTLCGGQVQGIVAHKISSCLDCSFYQRVRSEEGDAFSRSARILPLICDPSDVVRAYEQLEKTLLQLRDTQDKLVQVQKMEAVGKVAAGVAHELNSPLTGILTIAEDLAGELDGQARQDLEFIVHEALRCRQIVRDLLDYSRRSKPRRSVTPLWPIIHKSIALVRKQPAFREIDIVSHGERPDLCIIADANQIQQVMLNLVINARDAMKGKGTVTLIAEEHSASKRVVVEVKDHGCGIPQEYHERIFDPFYSTKGERGNGMGLAAVRRIIEENAATIEVDSMVGEGATFRMQFVAGSAASAASR